MNVSQFKPFKQYLFLQFDLQPNIRERNPVVKRDPTVLFLWLQMKLHLFVYRETVWRFDGTEWLGEVCVLCDRAHHL